MIARTALLALAVAACDSDATAPDATIDVTDLAYAPCAPATRIGGFEVVLAADYTGVQGQVFDSVLPTQVPTTLVAEGACALVAAPSPACAPACTASEVCTAAGTCAPYPVAHAIGDVTVGGLAAAVTMAPRAPTYFYAFTGTLPHPGFAAGDGIALTAAGGDYAGFALRGWGIEPLVVTAQTIELVRATPLALTWTAPSQSGPAKVTISVTINGHGLVGSHVECTVDDTGAYTIPAMLITQLVDAGVSGFPTITLSRSSADATTIEPGCVDLRVHADAKLDVTIPGLQSCSDDLDCTAPQTCQGDLTCG